MDYFQKNMEKEYRFSGNPVHNCTTGSRKETDHNNGVRIPGLGKGELWQEREKER